MFWLYGIHVAVSSHRHCMLTAAMFFSIMLKTSDWMRYFLASHVWLPEGIPNTWNVLTKQKEFQWIWQSLPNRNGRKLRQFQIPSMDVLLISQSSSWGLTHPVGSAFPGFHCIQLRKWLGSKCIQLSGKSWNEFPLISSFMHNYKKQLPTTDQMRNRPGYLNGKVHPPDW